MRDNFRNLSQRRSIGRRLTVVFFSTGFGDLNVCPYSLSFRWDKLSRTSRDTSSGTPGRQPSLFREGLSLSLSRQRFRQDELQRMPYAEAQP